MHRDGQTFVILVSGEPVTVTVVHERPETLAAYGFPAERTVYVVTWDDSSDSEHSDQSECV